jgi:hypothetical protein
MPPYYSSRRPEEKWLTVEDPEQARLLSDLNSFEFFEPFIARERTASQAAAELGRRLDTVLYRVRQFLEAGLLQVTRLEKRAGRPIKQYRSVADAFFIPFAVTPFATLEDRLASQMASGNQKIVRSIAAVLRETGLEGRRIFRADNGTVWNQSASDAETPLRPVDPNMPAAIQYGTELYLGFEEAKALQRQLHELFESYGEREVGEGRKYLLQVALLPEVSE